MTLSAKDCLADRKCKRVQKDLADPRQHAIAARGGIGVIARQTLKIMLSQFHLTLVPTRVDDVRFLHVCHSEAPN